MGYIGKIPSAVPLTSADITDGIIVNADINANAAIESSKLSITSPLSITGNSTAGSEIRLPEDTDNGSNYVALKAADNIASNLTFTLPSADGSANQALITNGSGSLSFATVGATAGQVIQVLSATDSTRRTSTSTSYITASNTLSVTITPSSSSNKIFIIASGSGGCDGGRALWTTIYRNGTTNLGTSVGMTTTAVDSSGSANFGTFSCSYLDSPATTSATTYQLYFKTEATSTWRINSSTAETAMLSSITCFEIKG